MTEKNYKNAKPKGDENIKIDFQLKDSYNIGDFLRIITLLRSPDGCPWDREQTHESITSGLLEECHEVIEAINKADSDLLKEELGDVLLQVVFHADIARQENEFTFDDVVDMVSKKMIYRHPHVFGGQSAESADEVLKIWDSTKRKASVSGNQQELLNSIPRSLPALMRAAKVQKRAANVGFDYQTLEEALVSLEGELAELKSAVKEAKDKASPLASSETDGSAAAIEAELGDVLFSAVNVSRFAKLDGEQALIKATDKFIRRFSFVEDSLKENYGESMSDADLDRLNELWELAKHKGL